MNPNSTTRPPPQEGVLALRARQLAGSLLSENGSDVLDHAKGTSEILQGIGADDATCAAAWLFASPKAIEMPVIARDFGDEVAQLVAGMRKLRQLREIHQDSTTQGKGREARSRIEVLRRMVLAMSVDVRVVLLRLASRLQTLRHCAALKAPPPEAICRETMDLLAPLANRLGLGQLKWELEDLAFRFLDPGRYQALARSLEMKRREREAAIAQALDRLRADLGSAAVPAQLQGRPKHLYSIHKKMLAKALPLAAIHDLLAVRIIVDSVDACYAVLARVHALWSPVPAEFDDYVARPKPNGYQSLHTVVLLEDGAKLEVQVRTRAMHEAAEYGQASHWQYKEGAAQPGSDTFGARIAWVRQLLDWQHEMGEALGADTSGSGLDERVFALTPQGRVLELPAGATPIDFAYQLHTDLGHRCRGARIDGQLVPLTTVLRSGQTVEIIAARGAGGPQGDPAGPSLDWLNPSLAYLASSRARGKVRQWFAAREAAREQAEGRNQVERVLQREGRTSVSLDKLAERLGFAEPSQLFSAVFHGDIGVRAIEQAAHSDKPVAADPGADAVIAERLAAPASRSADTGILLAGVGALMHHLARCCHPLPPDPIAGFVTIGRGVTIHREDCPVLAGLRARSSERIISATWQGPGGLADRARSSTQQAGAILPVGGPGRRGPRQPGNKEGEQARRARHDARRYPVDLVIDGADRPGLLSDLSEILARENTPLTAVRRSTRRDGTRLHLTVEIAHADHLPPLLRRLAQVPQVSYARRG